MRKSLFYEKFLTQVNELGGFHNAHLHLDRANTLDDGYVDQGRIRVLESSHISLQKKHSLIASVHEGPAYDESNLRNRLENIIEELIGCNTRIADTMVDVCADRTGLNVLSVTQEIAKKYSDKIQVRCAAYSPFGFNDARPEMWSVFEQGAKQAEFIGGLPEADDQVDYPENIGFEEHCVRILALAKSEHKMLHVHTDQRNEPSESGTERLVEIIRREGAHKGGEDNKPMVWAVHAISPATYDEKRFQKLVDGMLETQLGVISCPSAALGMRQYRPVLTPTYNSIPRLLEMAVAGIPIRLGSDNIADMCSPSTTADLTDEIFILSAALRFYDINILSKFACGVALSPSEREQLDDHLKFNRQEIEKFMRKSGQ